MRVFGVRVLGSLNVWVLGVQALECYGCYCVTVLKALGFRMLCV